MLSWNLKFSLLFFENQTRRGKVHIIISKKKRQIGNSVHSEVKLTHILGHLKVLKVDK